MVSGVICRHWQPSASVTGPVSAAVERGSIATVFLRSSGGLHSAVTSARWSSSLSPVGKDLPFKLFYKLLHLVPLKVQVASD